MRKTARVSTTLLTLLLLAAASPRPAKVSDRQRALHLLDRLTFGARPADVDRVLDAGIDVWLDQQLHPERIPDRAIDARLSAMPTLQLSDAEIMTRYYLPLQRARKEAQMAAANAKSTDTTAPSAKDLARELRDQIPPEQRPQRVMDELTAQRILRAAESERQLNEVMVDFWMNHFNVFAGKGIDRFMLTSYERDVVRPRIWGKFDDLLLATAKSPAMLYYLDNARSIADPEHRPKANAQNQRTRATEGVRLRPLGRRGVGIELPVRATMPASAPRAPQPQQRGGLNENYAREIMELHTLGVDGGYTQKDVTELARVLTGWTIAQPEQGGGFIFRPRLHDVGEKTVLGVRIPAGGGMEEGEKMIRFLARQPATAHHIALKLCQRLVADDPPKALVDRVAKRFLETGGDLRETVKAVITSPEFDDPQYYRAKVKSPFEYVVSAVRATDAKIDNPLPLARQIASLGEPLYGAQPPTGYSDRGDAWMNTGALMGRLNFALALAANKIPGVHSDVTSLIAPEAAADPSRAVDTLAVTITGGSLSAETTKTIKSRIVERKSPEQDPWDNTQLPMVAGLILGSPEFQRQ